MLWKKLNNIGSEDSDVVMKPRCSLGRRHSVFVDIFEINLGSKSVRYR